MRNKIKMLFLVLAAVMTVGAAACDPKIPPAETSYNGVDFAGASFLSSVEADGNQTLNMAVMYDSSSKLTYNMGNAKLADGNTYVSNTENPMLKPVWKAIENSLNISIVNKSGGATNLQSQWDTAVAQFGSGGYDIINTSDVANINALAELENRFVDIKPFLGRMPNLNAFLADNDFVNATIQVDGKMYYAPYFDGYDDLERMFIMRADWVRKLLSGGKGQGDTAAVSGLNVYTSFLPESLPAQAVTVTKADGTGTETLNKLATTNIIKAMEGKTTGKDLLDAMKDYITARYGGYYSDPADLFIGQNASYDADELVALLRCVKANPKFVTGSQSMTSAQIWPIYPRDYTNDRTADILRFAQIWGVRGLDSRNGYLFIDEQGKLQDARMQADTYYGISKLNELYKEGLILSNFVAPGAVGTTLSGVWDNTDFRGKLNANNRGFMTYDYNQTTTLLNGLNGEVSATGPHVTNVNQKIEGFELMPVLPPFTVWKGKTYDANDNLTIPSTLSAGNFYRFTESWRSVKIDGWGILSNVSGKKLERALALFDYMYSAEGQKLMSFGPDEWIADSNESDLGGVGSKAEGTMTYMGREVPRLASQTLTELKEFASGNYTNYYRRYLGGTMPIGYVKDQSMEYQTTHESGKVGQDIINNALLTGTLKHLAVGDDYKTVTDPTYKTVPTTLPFTASQQQIVKDNFRPLNNNFDISSTSSSAGANLFYEYIISGFGTAASGDPKAANRLTAKALRECVTSPSSASATFNLNCSGYLLICQSAYSKIIF